MLAHRTRGFCVLSLSPAGLGPVGEGRHLGGRMQRRGDAHSMTEGSQREDGSQTPGILFPERI